MSSRSYSLELLPSLDRLRADVELLPYHVGGRDVVYHDPEAVEDGPLGAVPEGEPRDLGGLAHGLVVGTTSLRTWWS